MQDIKNITAIVKQQLENTASAAEEKKEVTKLSTEEKVDKFRAHDETGKEEATRKKLDREAVAERHKDEKISQNAAEKNNVVNPSPIGDAPTPADLDMDTENPSTPSMASAMPTSTAPTSVAPAMGGVA